MEIKMSFKSCFLCNTCLGTRFTEILHAACSQTLPASSGQKLKLEKVWERTIVELDSYDFTVLGKV